MAALLCGACSHPQIEHVTWLTFTGPGGEPDTLNPLLTQESDVADFSLLYMPVLFEDGDRGQLVPEVATKVPTLANGGVSPDGRTIVYHLRRGVVWDDGAPLTAADIVFTYHAIMNPQNNVGSRIGYDRIASVVAQDPYTVIVHLRRRYSPIIAIFCNYPAYPILPAHVLGRYDSLNSVPFNSFPTGAGPYHVVDWERGDHITLAANPLYWRGKPHIERLIFRFIPDANTAVWQLSAGELGAWFNADPNTLPELLRERIHVVTSPMNDIHLLLFNLRDPILQDRRVRRAIADSLDRTLIIRAVVHGLGVPVDGDQPTFSWAYHSPADPIHYDPGTASTLLGNRQIQLQIAGTSDVTAWTTLGPLLQEELRGVGIDATIKTYPPSLFFAPAEAGGILRGGRFQIAYSAYLLGADPDDEEYYGCDQFPPYGSNEVRWCDRTADAAIRDAQESYSVARRARDYAVVQERMANDLPMVPLWEVRRLDAFHTPILGFSPSPAGPTFWNAWSWRVERHAHH